MSNAIKLSGRTFLAPHRGSCPEGLCKRTGFLGVKRRENPVRRHFERSEMRGQHYGYIQHCSMTAGMPLLPSALPPKGEASRYVAIKFLNLIALPIGEDRLNGTIRHALSPREVLRKKDKSPNPEPDNLNYLFFVPRSRKRRVILVLEMRPMSLNFFSPSTS